MRKRGAEHANRLCSAGQFGKHSTTLSQLQHLGIKVLRMQLCDLLVILVLFQGSYCKSNWCWLCRSTCGPDHFTMLNPLGCPGLGEERHTLNEWPWHKICWRKVKALLLFFLLYLLCVLIYPFYVAYIVIRRMGISLEGPLW